MAPTLEEIVYDLARAALDEQRDVVAGLRSRAAPVLAGAGALAALRADPAIGDGLSFSDHAGHALLVCAGIAGAVGALLGAILVLATRDFGFSVDADRLYDAAYADRERPERLPASDRGVASPAADRQSRRRPCPATVPPWRRRRGRWLATALAVH